MSQPSRHERLAEVMASFKITVERDLEGRLDLPKQESAIVYEDLGCDLILRCETFKGHIKRKRLIAAERDTFKQDHNVYYDQYQRQDSELWKNLSSPVKQVYINWIEQSEDLTLSVGSSTPYHYDFSPSEGECLQNALSKVCYFYKTKPSRHMKKLTLSYYNTLVRALFDGTGIPEDPEMNAAPAYRLSILRELRFTLEKELKWEDQKFLKILPGRYPITRENAKSYIEALMDWFLKDPEVYTTVGETCLVIWLLLAGAYHKRRSCTVADIFKIKESDIISTKPASWNSFEFGRVYYLKVKDERIYISHQLAQMLLALSDQRSKNNIIQIDRSTVENHLQAISKELGFDHKADPVTPETFLEQPQLHELRRCDA